MIAQAALADALVLVPPGDAELAAGTPVRYLSSVGRAERRLASPPAGPARDTSVRTARGTGPAARARSRRVRRVAPGGGGRKLAGGGGAGERRSRSRAGLT